jgi:hypothetical protein
MSNDKEKKQQLTKLKPKKYRVYGIFNFTKKKLVYVNLDMDAVKFEYDLEYNTEDYDIISFDIILT